MAGLTYAAGEAVILMDVDLQDPVDVSPRLIQEWENVGDFRLLSREVVEHIKYCRIAICL